MQNQTAIRSKQPSRKDPFVETEGIELFSSSAPLLLESGEALSPVTVAYQSYGTLNAEGTNALLVCHALTGSAHAAGLSPDGQTGWWDGIIGNKKALDTSKYFVICSNFLGSCYGTTGPSSTNPATGKPYRMDFPQISVRDMVRVQHELMQHLGVRKLAAVIGGSLGGMQVLEWALMYPDFVDAIIPIATSARHSAWCIGWGEIERLAILNDPAWKSGAYTEQPHNGLALARMIAMISYRSKNSYEDRFGHKTRRASQEDSPFTPLLTADTLFEMETYLHHQGKKLVDRFDAATYIYITRAMDSHDMSRNRGSVKSALGSITARTLCIGVDSDVLYPTTEQQQIAAQIPSAEYDEIASLHGHDAFLIEVGQLNRIVSNFLQ